MFFTSLLNIKSFLEIPQGMIFLQCRDCGQDT